MTMISVITPKLTQYRTPLFVELAKRTTLSVIEFAGEPDRPWEAAKCDRGSSAVEPFTRAGLSSEGDVVARGKELWGVLDELDPQWVVLPGWASASSWAGLAWAKRRRRKSAVVFESWKPQRTGRGRAVTALARRSFLAQSDVRLAVSSRAADYAMHLGFAAPIVHWNVADVEAAASCRVPGREEGNLRLLFAGRYLKIKNIDLLVEFAGAHRADVDLRFMGAGPALTEAARDGFSPTDLGSIAGNARFDEMAKADALVLVSDYEPWGVVVHEALAAGTPVLASRSVGSVPELVHEGLTGAIAETTLGGMADGVRRIRSLLEGSGTGDQCEAAARTITYPSVVEELLQALRITG